MNSHCPASINPASHNHKTKKRFFLRKNLPAVDKRIRGSRIMSENDSSFKCIVKHSQGSAPQNHQNIMSEAWKKQDFCIYRKDLPQSAAQKQ